MSTFDTNRNDATRALGAMQADAIRTAQSCGDTRLGALWQKRAEMIARAIANVDALPGIGAVLVDQEQEAGAHMAAEIENAARARVAEITPGILAHALASGFWPDYRDDLATVLRADHGSGKEATESQRLAARQGQPVTAHPRFGEATATQSPQEPERCKCGRPLDASGEHEGGYGAFCG